MKANKDLVSGANVDRETAAESPPRSRSAGSSSSRITLQRRAGPGEEEEEERGSTTGKPWKGQLVGDARVQPNVCGVGV